MAIELSDVTPSINLFNAQVARGDAERRQEQADFRQRYGFEQEQGADKARREAVAAAVAARRAPAAPPAGNIPGSNIPPGNAPPMPPAVAPAQAPAIAQFTAQPDTFRTDLMRGGKVIAPNISGALDMGNEQPLPAAQTAVAPSAPAATPAISSYTAPATAASPRMPVSAAAPGARQPAARAGTDDILSRLTSTPGTGKEALSLYAADENSRRQAATAEHQARGEGIKLFADASKNNDVGTMRAVAAHYQLGIPPEALNNREIMAKISTGMGIAKELKITDDNKAIAFAKGYIHAEAGGADTRTAVQAGLAEAQKVEPGFKAVHWATSPDNEVMGFDASGAVKKTGQKAHPPKSDMPSIHVGGDRSSQEERGVQRIIDADKAKGITTDYESALKRHRAVGRGREEQGDRQAAIKALGFAVKDRAWRTDRTGTLNRYRSDVGLGPVDSAPSDDIAAGLLRESGSDYNHVVRPGQGPGASPSNDPLNLRTPR